MAPAATAAPKDKLETARFVSKGRNYRAILLNPIDHPHPVTGDRVKDQRGFTAEFARKPFDPEQHESDGSFVWPPVEGSEEAPFVNEHGNYVDPISAQEIDVIAMLRNHPDFGVRFDEVGPDPAELLAEQRELLDEIAQCIARKDDARLAVIYEEEQAGHGRDAVLSAAMSGMKAIEAAG